MPKVLGRWPTASEVDEQEPGTVWLVKTGLLGATPCRSQTMKAVVSMLDSGMFHPPRWCTPVGPPVPWGEGVEAVVAIEGDDGTHTGAYSKAVGRLVCGERVWMLSGWKIAKDGVVAIDPVRFDGAMA